MKATRILFGLFSVFVIIPCFLGGALFFLNEKGFFNLDRIEVLVEGVDLEAHYLKPQVEQVEKLIEKNRGESLWKIDISDLQKKIGSLNWVDNISIARQWPTTLRAKIRPFDIKLLLLSKRGQFIPIVKNGESLDPVDLKNAPEATVLRGEVFQKNIEMRKLAVEVFENIPSDGSFSRPEISEIFYREKEGFWVNLVRSGIEVRLGRDQVPLKSARVSQVLNYLQSHQIEARVIDADLSQKVLVRLRKDP